MPALNSFNFFKNFSEKAEADMLKKLSLYLSAHLSLDDSLRLLEEQADSKFKKEAFRQWIEVVESGKTLATAFSETKGAARVSEVSRYSAELGEKSGSLAKSLKGAGVQIQKKLATKKKVLGAVAYPGAILVGTIGLVLGLMLFVFPKIIPLFTTLKVQLPLSTRMLIGFSFFLTHHWLALILGILVISASLVVLYLFSPKSKEWFDWAMLRVPLIGGVVRARTLCGLFDSLSTLLQGGEQLSEALLYVSGTTSYNEYKSAVTEASRVVTDGRSLAEYFRANKKLFPVYVFGIISVGERTGNLEQSVKDISEIASEQLDDTLRVLTAALEPLLMVSMSFVIGFIALSIILPIYGITSHFQNV